MKRFLAAGSMLLFAAAGARLFAADDLPKADSIIDKYIEVTGGKAAYEKSHSEVASGTMQIAGMTGTITMYRAQPDKTYAEIELQGIGKILKGSDGKIAWQYSAMQGPHLAEGAEKEQALMEGRFDADVNWRANYPKVETVGSEMVDGKDCYKVVLTPKTGNPATRYYDKKTGLMTKITMTVNTPMGDIPSDTIPSDYRKEGDLLVAHKITQKAMGQEIVISIDKIQYNTEIPASKWDAPPEIQALLKK